MQPPDMIDTMGATADECRDLLGRLSGYSKTLIMPSDIRAGLLATAGRITADLMKVLVKGRNELAELVEVAAEMEQEQAPKEPNQTTPMISTEGARP